MTPSPRMFAMRTVYVASIAAVLFSAAAPAAPVPEDRRQPTPCYYPTRPTAWIYDTPGGDETLGIKGELQVVGEAKVATVEIDIKIGGGSMVVEFVAVSRHGLASVNHAGEPEHVLLPVPFRVGDTWNDGSDHVKFCSKILRTERLKVPAGTFETVCVETSSAETGKPPTVVQIWYARDVGVVKKTDHTGTWVLKELWKQK